MVLEISVVELALKQIGSSIQAYLKGNRAEIDKLERAIDEIDRELVPVMSRESPEKLLEYLTNKVELTLKIEELKVQKGVSIVTLLKGWAPALAPLLAAVMAFIGVLIGAQIQTDSSQQASVRDALRREAELVVSIVSGNSSAEASTKLKALVDIGLIKQIDSTAVSELATKLNLKQPKDSLPNTAQSLSAANTLEVDPESSGNSHTKVDQSKQTKENQPTTRNNANSADAKSRAAD